MIRWKNIKVSGWLYQLSRKFPKGMKKLLLSFIEGKLQDKNEVQRSFNPKYDPWDQRMCFVPDDDLFKAINQGLASGNGCQRNLLKTRFY
ncbi:MAG: hypothetical protein R2827_02690 [Bdellovibrionales bacterium]